MGYSMVVFCTGVLIGAERTALAATVAVGPVVDNLKVHQCPTPSVGAVVAFGSNSTTGIPDTVYFQWSFQGE